MMENVTKKIRRISIAKAAFNNMNRILTDLKIEMFIRVRMLKCYGWSVQLLVYGIKTWTLSITMRKMIQATEMWFLR